MKLVIPSELSESEKRVSITPDCVSSLKKMGFNVCVQSNAGILSSFTDNEYKKSGATIISKSNEVIDLVEAGRLGGKAIQITTTKTNKCNKKH